MKTPCFVPLPDSVQESEVNLTLQWSADERTTIAIQRQAESLNLSPDKYLHDILAAAIAGNQKPHPGAPKEDFRIRADDAEKYVARMVDGKLCRSIHSPYDVLSGSGDKLEVKSYKLVSPNVPYAPDSRIWKFHRLFGDYRNKIYDRLILVGLATQRAQYEDRCNGREPRSYEIFDLSFEDAQILAQLTKFHSFQVNTNRQRVHSPVGRLVWERHIEPEELVQRYSMEKKP